MSKTLVAFAIAWISDEFQEQTVGMNGVNSAATCRNLEFKWFVASHSCLLVCAYQIRPIPVYFGSLEAYYSCLQPPFLEDTICSVRKTLQSVHCRPFAHQFLCHPLQTPNAPRLRDFQLAEYVMGPPHRLPFNNFPFKKFQLLLLAEKPIDMPLATLLSTRPFFFTLALVTSQGHHWGHTATDYMTLIAFGLQSPWRVSKGTAICHVVGLDNMSTKLRTWDGLNPPGNCLTTPGELRIVADSIYHSSVVRKSAGWATNDR